MSELTRRALLGTALAGAGALLLAPRGLAAETGKAPALAPELLTALEKSPFVYVSPLKKDGAESSCHGEVWFAWDQGSVVLATSKRSWKARALAHGLERARIWVGDFGTIHLNQVATLRNAPRFEARARIDSDPGAFPRVAPVYARKYPDEWASKWKARFEQGMADGSRVLIRYTPEPQSAR
jgi:hypothetical protein